ncbi:MAG: lytic transglycosylase domain-containing protein, partial [Actinomycetota bacterium]|nr:lytic transglycosylase domain-containing protein [Actinomycetota bacterium]
MSSATHVSRRSSGTRARGRRRRLVAVAVAALLGAGGAAIVAGVGPLDDALREAITLPLKHDDIIRQQAADKDVDAALIAAVIYAESRFIEGRTSTAGAIGLMQITPATARYIARLSGGTQFEQGDLATPQINISYGAYYLRYLLERYGGNTVLALAAYNGGEGNVDRRIVDASMSRRAFVIEQIPFAETREYVTRVLGARQRYREKYSR